MTLDERLDRLAHRSPPRDSAEVLAAARTRATARPKATSRSRMLAAAAVLAVLLLGAGALVLSGGGDGGERDGVVAGPGEGSDRSDDAAETVTLADVPAEFDEVTEAEFRFVNEQRGGLLVPTWLPEGLRAGRLGWVPSGDTLHFADADGQHYIRIYVSADGRIEVTSNGFDETVERRVRESLRPLAVPTEDHAVPAPMLPGWVPDGFRLAWVDTPPEPPAGNDGVALHERRHHYAFGYQTDGFAHEPDGAELEVRVFVGASIDDPEAVAAAWDRGAEPGRVGDRPAVWWSRAPDVTLLAEVDGGVVMVRVVRGVTPPPGDADAATSDRELIERFAASMAPVGNEAWAAELASSGADVASTFGPKEGTAVVDGDGWSLVYGQFRAPLSVRHPAVWVDFGGRTSMVTGSAFEGAAGAAHQDVDPWMECWISEHERTAVAWGILLARVSTVEVTGGDQVFAATAVAVDADATVFAVEVPGAAEADRCEAQDENGTIIASDAVVTE